MPKISKAIRLAYYICHNGRLQWRLSATLHRELLAGVKTAPAFANTRQSILEIQYDGGLKRTHVRGLFYVFDGDGKFDMDDSLEALEIAPNEKPLNSQSGIIDIQPVLRGNRWSNQHFWSPTPELVDAVETDLRSGKGRNVQGKVPILK